MRRRIGDAKRLARALEGAWLPIAGRLHGAWHLIRGHKVRWYHESDLWIGHLGWIYCEGCPDTGSYEEDPDSDGRGLYIWGRHWMWLMSLAQWRCGRQGHPDTPKRCTKWLGKLDDEGEHVMEEIDEWYCGRCLADIPPPIGTEG